MTRASAAARTSAPIVEGQYAFTESNFEEIRALLLARTGISMTPAKATLVYSRLAKRIRSLGLPDFDAYCDLLRSDEATAELEMMISALTTNVTRFFREPHHFEHLDALVRKRLRPAALAGERVRLWSAACSTGEEAYSIALCVLEAFPEAVRHDVRILATDIDTRVLERGRAGTYSEDAVEPIAAPVRDKWMKHARSDGVVQWGAGEEMRELVSFRRLNLIGPWPMQGRFDVIFCRNVVIYFEDATQSELWRRLGGKLTPEGRLYVGHSERVDVAGFASDGLTIYRLTNGGRTS